MEKRTNSILQDTISILPDYLITEEIFSFYNVYKILYDNVITEIKARYIFKSCMKQLKQYSIYDKNKNFISFQKYALLDQTSNHLF